MLSACLSKETIAAFFTRWESHGHIRPNIRVLSVWTTKHTVSRGLFKGLQPLHERPGF